jgi:hypothetical protein
MYIHGFDIKPITYICIYILCIHLYQKEKSFDAVCCEILVCSTPRYVEVHTVKLLENAQTILGPTLRSISWICSKPLCSTDGTEANCSAPEVIVVDA